MKRILCLGLALVLILSVFCACSQRSKDDTENPVDLTAPEIKDIDWFDFPAYAERNRIKDVKKMQVSSEYADKCEAYEFTYFSEKYEVKGFIAIPLECINTEIPYNCIVYNRGGNNNMGFLTGEEVAAMCGVTNRVVIASQYRGANGAQGKDEFGGADLEDVKTLVDMCDKEFRFVNIENLCMIGISRGGMMSYMVAREDERVKGIVAVSAVTDLVSSYYEREDMRDILHSAIGGSPEDLPEEYEKRSAINWTEEINASVFIIHSKDDELVSHSQAKAMNEKLKETKEGCTMITHLDNVHGLHPEDVESIVQWIDQALPVTTVQN